MYDKEYLTQVVNETVVSITKAVTGIELRPVSRPLITPEKGCFLEIRITGLEKKILYFFYQTQPDICLKIAEGMLGRPAAEHEEMEICVKEYYNMLCGRIISRVNRETKSSMRFGVPVFSETEPSRRGCEFLRTFYESPGGGSVSVIGVINNSD